MKKKLKRSLLSGLLVTALLLNLTACGSSSENDPSNKEEAHSDSPLASEEETSTDDSVLSDGKTTSNGWKEGIIKVNGKIFNLSKTTLEQFAECGYTTSDSEMNYILYENKKLRLQDNTHQEIELTVKNYSSDKPLYQKNALICDYQINYAVENGMEGADVILPGNIKGGMIRDEIVSIMGTPEPDSTDTSIYYKYKENDKTFYDLTLRLDDAGKLTSVSYSNYCERVNVTDDSDEIQNSLDTSFESTKTDKTSPSDSLEDAEVKIGSTVYTIPISIQDLTKLGYNTESDKSNYVLNPKEATDPQIFYTNFMDKGGNILSLDVFYNPSNSPRKLSNCMACIFSFNSETEGISIAKGIKIGSTYDDVCKAFGEKEKKEDKDKGSYSTDYSYRTKRGKVYVSFVFDSSNNNVTRIHMSVVSGS